MKIQRSLLFIDLSKKLTYIKVCHNLKEGHSFLTDTEINNKLFTLLNQRLSIIVIIGLILIISGITGLTFTPLGNLVYLAVLMFNKDLSLLNWSLILFCYSFELVVSGVLLVILYKLIQHWLSKNDSLAEYKNYLFLLGIILLFLLCFPIILFGRSTIIDGVMYWWLRDDAMISMRYAYNLAHGFGLVWNPGERVEGYTNFLWTIYMALVHLVGISKAKTSLVILLTNFIISISTIPLVLRLVSLLKGGIIAASASVIVYCLCGNIVMWCTHGMEATFLALIFIMTLCNIIEESEKEKPVLYTYLLIGILPLVRSDALVLSGILCLLSLIINKQKKAVIIYSLVSLVLPLAHLIFRYFYYGDLLPNTAYLKATNWGGRISHGVSYVFQFFLRYIIPLAFVIAGLIRFKRPLFIYLFSALILYSIYVAYIGGDYFLHFRFYIPFIPVLFALCFISIEELYKDKQKALTGCFLCIITIPLILPGYVYNYLSHLRNRSIGNLEIGLLLNKHLKANTKVADFHAGSVFYFSDVHGIDFLGKTDPYISHLPAKEGANEPGHNKYDYDYSIGKLKPDFVIANFKLPEETYKIKNYSSGDFGFTGQLYFNKYFQKHCLPNPIQVDTWRTIYVCDWSKHFNTDRKWEDLIKN